MIAQHLCLSGSEARGKRTQIFQRGRNYQLDPQQVTAKVLLQIFDKRSTRVRHIRSATHIHYELPRRVIEFLKPAASFTAQEEIRSSFNTLPGGG